MTPAVAMQKVGADNKLKGAARLGTPPPSFAPHPSTRLREGQIGTVDLYYRIDLILGMRNVKGSGAGVDIYSKSLGIINDVPRSNQIGRINQVPNKSSKAQSFSFTFLARITH